jgi:3-phosphoshikimate 1-carboxyvinyltransferase
MVNYKIQPGGSLQGSLRVPGDKSISHRAIILSALAEGVSTIRGFLTGDDCLATLKACQKLGVDIDASNPEKIFVRGVGSQGLKPATRALDLGNSGTSMRLLTGVLSGQRFLSQLTGDASLVKRPMARVLHPLRAMGADITATSENTAPLSIRGNPQLKSMTYEMPIASAQVKSCLLLAGLIAAGETVITEPAVTRDHTERMLQAFNYPIESSQLSVRLHGRQTLRATTLDIPADLSSAAFFLVAATIAKDSALTLESVGVNPTRLGVINILRLMGADIQLLNPRQLNHEPVADIYVRSAKLKAVTIPSEQISLAIDEFPVLFIAAAFAEGTTHLRGAQELRVKESDRLKTMAEGLTELGIAVTMYDDGISITGGELKGGCVKSAGDHRIAMAFAVAGLRAAGTVHVEDCANVTTSFPHFVTSAKKVGLSIEEIRHV